MEAKDRQVLDKIYMHICSVLKYCEHCKNLDDFQEDSMRVEACVFTLPPHFSSSYKSTAVTATSGYCSFNSLSRLLS